MVQLLQKNVNRSIRSIHGYRNEGESLIPYAEDSQQFPYCFRLADAGLLASPVLALAFQTPEDQYRVRSLFERMQHDSGRNAPDTHHLHRMNPLPLQRLGVVPPAHEAHYLSNTQAKPSLIRSFILELLKNPNVIALDTHPGTHRPHPRQMFSFT